MGVLTLDGLARGVAAVAAMSAAAACYEPDYRDCLATCSSDDRCGPGQVCGIDGLCASPAVAGRCAEVLADAGGGAIDAPPAPPPVDAEPPPPDAAMAHLRLLVSGKGRVVGDAFGIECTGSGNDDVGDCTFQVPLRASVTLVAVEIHHDWFFDRWEGTECDDRDACTVVVEPPATIVGATFRREDD